MSNVTCVDYIKSEDVKDNFFMIGDEHGNISIINFYEFMKKADLKQVHELPLEEKYFVKRTEKVL